MSQEFKNEVNNLLNDINEEEKRNADMQKWIENLPEEELMNALKAVNPYGVTLPVKTKDEESVSISYTNMRLEFTKRLVVTSMIGYIMRNITEYGVPEEVKPVDLEDYQTDPSVADPPAFVKDPTLLGKYEENKRGMAERISIYNFMKSIFDFDPDRHVTSALQTNTADPTRKVPNTAAVKRALLARKNASRASVKAASYEAKVTDATLEPTTEVEKAVYGMIPPLDTFAKYDRYLEEHYEQYMDAVHNIYGIQPDIDFCVIVYDKHDSEDEAKVFKERYMEQVIAPITNIKKNHWVALGPYRQNREKVDFFNRHTEVLKEMMDQRERDSHVATDIMKKKIKDKKAKNVAEAGPDDKEFRKYIKDNKPEISKMGGEHITDIKDDEEDECPEDAVEVNVFSVGDGGRDLKVHKIYNAKEDGAGNIVKGKKSHPLVQNEEKLVVSSL